MYKMALLVKKVEGAESCKFLTEEIMAAKNLHQLFPYGTRTPTLTNALWEQ